MVFRTLSHHYYHMTLKQAHKLLEDCTAVLVLDFDYPVLYPAVFDLTGEDDSVFLSLRWTNDEGHTFDYSFTEGANQEIQAGTTVMVLTDTNGSKIDIQILNVTLLNV